ncbi:hypothetical protein BP6252_10246 [Coleophoma cylindrospora]|uniref:Uncharacterized protein n=1 Tax=Coleophoma cylindrospora TaxID=1849047 RepID=A0A3D8QS17_9HELO|nr:hypothetical protein BP6252_10246 [Coleophoma cylindrospora]
MILMKVVSYLPIALYAESLHLHAALASVITSTFTLPPPLTGCIKDFGEIWRLKSSNIISGPDRFIVASLRHGSIFPLANKHLLDLAMITGRESHIEDSPEIWRPVVLHLSFLTPARRSGGHARFRMMYAVAVSIAIAVLLLTSSISFLYGFYISGILLLCLLLNLILLSLLQWFTGPIFSRQSEIAKDTTIGATGGAAVDVHVVTENFNASEMHVLIGFSAHLHSLTNIPIRIRSWRTVLWVSRLIGVVLAVQAAALASQFGADGKQVVGSGVWLIAYTVLLISSRLVTSRCPDALLRHQPTTADQLDHIGFSSRRAALAFIATLPVSQKAGRWDWMNGFVPADERRKHWEIEMAQGGLGEDRVPEDDTSISASSRGILEEVRKARSSPEFVEASTKFNAAIGLTKRSPSLEQVAPEQVVPEVVITDSVYSEARRQESGVPSHPKLL